MDKKYILFDLDGTIIDSGNGIKDSIKYSLKKVGLKEDREEVLNTFIGPPLVDSYMKNYGFSEEKAIEVVDIYREYYKDKGVYDNYLYNGIVDVLMFLKEKNEKIILATSKPKIFAEKVLAQHGIEKYFDFVAGATLDHKISNKIEVLQYIFENVDIDINNGYMIGDTEFDILGGKKFGLKTIGVTYGYGSLKELEEAGADKIANKPEDVLELI